MSLLAENTKRWNNMHVKPERYHEAQEFAERALANKPIYEHISARIRDMGHYIPWWAIALIHERECLLGTKNLGCNIGQGRPFNVRSNIVPYNGPFNSFEDAAVDSLVNQAPHAALNTNWSGGGTMTVMERYNGLKYARAGRPSPYCWSGTDQYKIGKVIRDHGPIEPVVDPQLGCAIMLSALIHADPTITLDGNLPNQEKTDRTKEIVHTTTGAGSIAEASHQALINGVDDWIVYTVAAVAVAALIYWVYRIYKKKKGEI
jgi:lysozyme family protein